MIRVAPSILSADFARLGEDIQSVEQAGADYLHFDVMDGAFVDNISIGVPVLKSIRKITCIPIDAHLMIYHPLKYAGIFCDAGADIVTVHEEAASGEELREIIDLIHKKGKKAGMAVRPGTDASAIKPFLPSLDLALVMTVVPGFGGQGFMEQQVEHIIKAKEMIDELNPSCELEVDGGINGKTAEIVKKAGANVLVSGSYIYAASNRREAVNSLR